MKLLTLLTATVLPYLALAGPAPTSNYNKCLSDSEAETYVNAWISVLGKKDNWRSTAKKYFGKDMISISDSDSFYEQIAPLNSTLFSTRSSFLDYIGTKSGGTFNTLFTAHSCNTITWYAQFSPGGIPVRIMHVMFVDKKRKKIYKNFWEYNTGIVLSLQNDSCKGDREFNVGTQGLKKERANCRGVS